MNLLWTDRALLQSKSIHLCRAPNYASCVVGHHLDSGGVAGIWFPRTTVVCSGGKRDVTMKSVQQISQQQRCVCRQNVGSDRIELQLLRRTKALWKLCVIAFVFAIEPVGIA